MFMSTSEGIVDKDSAAELLFSLCPDSIKLDTSTEIRLDSPESFAYLLYINDQLFRQFEEARPTGNLDDIWQRCLRKWLNFSVPLIQAIYN